MTTNNTKTSLLYTIGINTSQALRLSAYGIVLLFLAAAVFSSITGSADTRGINPLIALAAYGVTMVAHEATHGLFFKLYGGKPKYGVGLMYYFFPYAYATSPGDPYSLRQMITIGLSPFFIICVLAVLASFVFPSLTPYAAVVFVGNFAGAVGDMWLIRQILRFRKVHDVTFVDLKNGIAVHGDAVSAQPVLAAVKQAEDPNTAKAKITKIWLISAGVMTALAILAPILLAFSGYDGQILIGPSQFPLFAYETSGDSGSFQLGVVPILLASLLYALLYVAIRKRRPKLG